MDAATRTALSAINRRFYQHVASQFSDTRRRPWRGWQRVVDRLTVCTNDPPAVLDIGCGNGRFATYLASRWSAPFRYTGLDNSVELLRIAVARLGDLDAVIDLRRSDVLAEDLDESLVAGRFGLITLFGVMHHLPGGEARRALLRRLGSLLVPGGMVAVSVWRFDSNPRFARRVVPWDTYNRLRRHRSQPPLDLTRLEAGDVLLSWAGDTEYPRYCHFPEDAEIASWIEAMEPPLIDRFEADGSSGKDNLYLVFRSPRS